ncbi:MAG: NAD(P)H-binding protein [Bauldia litoralis]
MARILVTGATGRIGAALLPLLRDRGHAVRAVTRRPDAGAAIAEAGAEAVVADIRSPDSLREAFAEADAVFLLTADAPDQDDVERGLIESAAAAGRPHIVKLSAQSAGLAPPRSFGIFHRRAERALAESGLPHTILRPVFFQQSLLLFAGDIAAKGKFAAPAGTGRIAMVDTGDIAACAAIVLADPAHHGQTYTLTGPAAHSLPEVAGLLGEKLGRRIGFASPPAFVARLVLPFVTGMPRWQSNLAVDLFAAIREGAQEAVSPDVERLTGRPATGLDAFLAAHIDAFRG